MHACAGQVLARSVPGAGERVTCPCALTAIRRRCRIVCMHRTQIQIPDPLYREVKRIAKLRDWSVSEVFRRAVEQLVREIPENKTFGKWQPPTPRDLGTPKVPPERWRNVLADDQTRPG